MGERKKQPKMIPKAIKNHWKYGLGPSRVLPGEARGPVWPQGGPGLEKGTKTMRNTTPFLALKWRPGPTFRGLFFSCFFRCSCFRFFMILGARGFIFSSILALLWELWAFGKTVESVVRVVNFRGLAPARLILFTGPDCGCVSVTFFYSFLWLLAVWEFPVWELLGLIAVKKEVWKKTQKRSKKRSTSHAVKTVLWAVGPLKNKKTRHQDIRKPRNRRGGSNTPWRT